jgi:hypothetical protein
MDKKYFIFYHKSIELLVEFGKPDPSCVVCAKKATISVCEQFVVKVVLYFVK